MASLSWTRRTRSQQDPGSYVYSHTLHTLHTISHAQYIYFVRTYILIPCKPHPTNSTCISYVCFDTFGHSNIHGLYLYSHTLHTIFHTLHTIFSHPTHYIPRTCARQIGRDFFGVWVGQQPPVFWSVRVCVRERVCVHA